MRKLTQSAGLAVLLAALLFSATARADGPLDFEQAHRLELERQLGKARTYKRTGIALTVTGIITALGAGVAGAFTGVCGPDCTRMSGALARGLAVTGSLTALSAGQLGTGIRLWSLGRAHERQAQMQLHVQASSVAFTF
jgi:hypothetical protein